MSNINLQINKESAAFKCIINTKHSFDWQNAMILAVHTRYSSRIMSNRLHSCKQIFYFREFNIWIEYIIITSYCYFLIYKKYSDNHLVHVVCGSYSSYNF